ncbi:MAG: RNA 3'-terminal phosphate cyclase [Candidatus Pacearchaeota archaeon]|nr:MAG: RNA 3'-terminal phosphate cyclase [Candidatus Pacearchaeota archaeon]
MKKEVIEIDGSFGTGGGQIIRTAIAMSALTNKACRIKNVRAKREKPGLRPQHLTGVKAVAQLCQAKIKGADIGSRELVFMPSKIKAGIYNFDIGTAGSITLVLQALMPAALHAPDIVKFNIIGGTNVPLAPSAEYFQYVFSDFLAKMGVNIKTEILRYGFFPKGGGKMKVQVKPCKKLKPLSLTERGGLIKIDCWSIASSGLKQAKVAERQIESFEKQLKQKINKKNIIYADSPSPGTAIHTHAHYKNCKLGADTLGKRGLPAEKVGKKCANLLLEEMKGGGVDSHAVDQLLPFMALAGKGKILANSITEHARTNSFVIEKFLPVKFKIRDKVIEVSKV